MAYFLALKDLAANFPNVCNESRSSQAQPFFWFDYCQIWPFVLNSVGRFTNFQSFLPLYSFGWLDLWSILQQFLKFVSCQSSLMPCDPYESKEFSEKLNFYFQALKLKTLFFEGFLSLWDRTVGWQFERNHKKAKTFSSPSSHLQETPCQTFWNNPSLHLMTPKFALAISFENRFLKNSIHALFTWVLLFVALESWFRQESRKIQASTPTHQSFPIERT